MWPNELVHVELDQNTNRGGAFVFFLKKRSESMERRLFSSMKLWTICPKPCLHTHTHTNTHWGRISVKHLLELYTAALSLISTPASVEISAIWSVIALIFLPFHPWFFLYKLSMWHICTTRINQLQQELLLRVTSRCVCVCVLWDIFHLLKASRWRQHFPDRVEYFNLGLHLMIILIIG